MKSRPRRRYKKKKHDLILYLKIALIFYLTMFGVGYMSSDTSAYLSSQSEITEIITADVWVDPETVMNVCGKEYTTDGVVSDETGTNDEIVSDEIDTNDEVVSGEVESIDGVLSDNIDTNDEVVSDELYTNDEVDADSSIEEVGKEVVVDGEVEIDCSGQNDASAGACHDDEESLAVEENQEDAGSIIDCINTDDVSNEDSDKAEEVEILEIDKENQNELEDEDMDSDRKDHPKTNTEDSQINEEQNSTNADESSHLPDSNQETIESGIITPTDQDLSKAETLDMSVD